MRLTALCIFGTLLALTRLPWTAANSGEEDLLGDKGFMPCAARLRPEGACRQGQDENTCPYLLSLPPLTIHLPKQLMELEKIVKDLQQLKDNVDQLRKMCADCTVSQSERECGRQREREHEKLNEGADKNGDEWKNWMNEKDADRLKYYGTDGVNVEITMEGDGDSDTENRTTLDGKVRNKWEPERQSKKVIKENEKGDHVKEVAEKDGKGQTKWTEVKDKLGQTKVPTSAGKESLVDMERERGYESNIRDGHKNKNKEKDGKGFLIGEVGDTLDSEQERMMTINMKSKEKIPDNDHDVGQDETKEKKTQKEEDRSSHEIKMSKEYDEHTNKMQEQYREERKKEMDKGIKARQNNEKAKQNKNSGRTEKKKTVQEVESEKVVVDRETETGREIKTKGEKSVQIEQRDNDEVSTSIKATESMNSFSISPTESATGLDGRDDSTDNKMITGFSQDPNPTTTDTINTLDSRGHHMAYYATSSVISTTSIRPRAGFQVSTTTPRYNSYTTTYPGVTDHSHSTAKKNRWTAKTGVKPLPDRAPQSDKKYKPVVKPEADQRPKNPRNYRKPDQGPLPDKTTKHDIKQKPSLQKPTTDQEPKPEQRALSDPNLKNNLIPKHDQNHTTKENKLLNQKLNSYQKSMLPVQRPTSERPVTVNTTSPDKAPLTDRQPEDDKISITIHNRKTETGREIKTKGEKSVQIEQRDSDEVSTSIKATESTNSVSISPTESATGLDGRDDSTDNKMITGFSQDPNPTTTDKINTLDSRGHHMTYYATSGFISTTSIRPRAGFQVSATSPRYNSYTTTYPGVTDHSHLTAKENRWTAKTGVKPLPDRAPQSDKKYKPVVKPEADQRPKNQGNYRKPDRAPLPDKTTKHDLKQKPSLQKPTTVQEPKPEQRALSDPNLKNNLIPKHDQNHTTEENKFLNQKLNSYQKSMLPVQRPTSERPVTVNTTSPDKAPLTDRQPEDDKISIINHNPSAEILHYSPKTNKPDQKQTPGRETTSKATNKPDQGSEPKQNFTHVQESEKSQTTHRAPKNRPATEWIRKYDGNPSFEPKSNQDSVPGQRLPPRVIMPPVQKPKSSHKISTNNQKPKPGNTSKFNREHPVIVTNRKPNPQVKPRPGQGPQNSPKITRPLTAQMPSLNSKSVPDKTSKTGKPRPPPRHRQPTRPVLKPRTPVQRPKPAVQQKPKPSPKTKADLDVSHISVTTLNSIQNSQTDLPPTSGAVKQTDELTRSPGDAEISPSPAKTITLSVKTSYSLETRSFPHLHTLPESFTMSPRSRTTSDLRPQAVGEPVSRPVKTRPNNIIRGSFPSVFSSTRPSPDPDKMMIPVPSPTAHSTSTVSSDFRSTTFVTSGPKLPVAESSTPSARELRVKINQVAALFNNSLGLNGKPLDREPKEHLEDKQRVSSAEEVDRKLPTLTSPKVTSSRRDCSDLLLRGETSSGLYLVTPDMRSKSFPVFCDMELGGGGWTLIQRRQDGSVNFNRTWVEYRSGFGELDGGEFWLGNNMIHLLTRDRDMVLRVELEDFDGVMEHAQYEQFRVASERLRYRLTVGGYSGNAGDALRFNRLYDHNNRAFTTPDKDHDRYPSGNCGAYYSSGWWFDACMAANLNGRYYVERYKGIRDGIFWGTWRDISTEYYPTNYRHSFKAVRMMIRPKGFAP